ncbi:MAG TPA: protein phosphatase 2C domain-containing protein [Candidatus Paceibacterota bacterium]|nr:protein phosphatase 2C domain-containing protein [Candidatus Paceibacterota bacterium]
MELLPFSVAGGSVPGTEHTKPGQPGWTNNQDAFAWSQVPGALAAVVCDGCGGAPKSEVGSQLAAPFIALRLAELCRSMSVDEALLLVNLQLKNFLSATANHLAHSVHDVPNIAGDYFLFTVLGVVMTPERTVIFEAGDGVYAVNGEVVCIPPYPDNAPPYLGHRLTGWYPQEKIGIRIRADLPTAKVNTILIGTDGVADAIAVADELLPGKRQGEVFGPIQQFVENDLFVRNPDAIRRRLALANRELVDGEHIKKGLLPDDTTLVVVQRRIEGGSNA